MSGDIVDFRESVIKRLVEERRPPLEIRDQLDTGYDYHDNTLILLEIRPRWDIQDEIMRIPYAKAKFIKSKSIWRIYWMRASGKWELYKPGSEVRDITTVFDIIDADEYGCFRG